MKWVVALLLLTTPLACQARGHRYHSHRSHFVRYRSRVPLQPLVYNGQSAAQLLEMGGTYTRESLVAALGLALAPRGNRMLPCVLDFKSVMQDGGYARFLADWEPAAREELLVYLEQLECEDTLRMTREVISRVEPTEDELAEFTRQWVDDGDNLNDALWDYCYDHQEELLRS